MVWITVAVLGGISAGAFGLPMKFTTRWKWENTWNMWAIWTLLALPWLIAFLTVPNLMRVYSNVSWGALFMAFAQSIVIGIVLPCGISLTARDC